MNQESNQHRLDTLRHQWRSEPTPRRTLQLAEEYGRLGDYNQAVEVLRAGLEKHPSHVASRVALGRYLLDIGKPAEARKVLEQIALEDQTHLVANKLLVESHLALGEAAEARNRLDLYTLLNESDSDIESFETRLAALGTQTEETPDSGEAITTGAAVEAEAAEPSTDVEYDGAFPASRAESPAAGVGFRGGVGDLSSESRSPEPGELEVSEDPFLAPGSPQEGRAREAVEGADAPAAGEGDLFQDVWTGVRRKSYWDALGSDGIFALEPRASESEAEQPPVAWEAATGATAEAEAVVEELEAPAPPTPPTADPEVVSEPEMDVEPGDEVVESTVTLGRLYLEQGHSEEAGRVFQEVLARDPGNRSALAGLAATESKPSWTLTAAELVPAEVLRTASKTECRRELLTAYLARVKPEAARVGG